MYWFLCCLYFVFLSCPEISPLIRQDPLSLDKLLPVTASVTMLPINTALSRPPPQVHVAHPPEPPPSLVALASDHQLEALLEGTLSADTEPRALRLMEELHSQLLEQPHSLMDTDELAFPDTPHPPLHLHDTNLDNMEWLDLTAPGPTSISAPAVFSSDFLDSHDLNWDWSVQQMELLKRTMVQADIQKQGLAKNLQRVVVGKKGETTGVRRIGHCPGLKWLQCWVVIYQRW